MLSDTYNNNQSLSVGTQTLLEDIDRLLSAQRVTLKPLSQITAAVFSFNSGPISKMLSILISQTTNDGKIGRKY